MRDAAPELPSLQRGLWVDNGRMTCGCTSASDKIIEWVSRLRARQLVSIRVLLE